MRSFLVRLRIVIPFYIFHYLAVSMNLMLYCMAKGIADEIIPGETSDSNPLLHLSLFFLFLCAGSMMCYVTNVGLSGISPACASFHGFSAESCMLPRLPDAS